jgi:glycosyltransferase involved in cell wall biosynthesis/2-polyprenyl-3-methyl-5-hydroxy-6-metoxy-1,4-benzoquinol methylase
LSDPNSSRRDFFDGLASAFGDRYRTNAAFRQRLDLFDGAMRAAVPRLPAGAAKLCFDLGCGPGVMAAAAARAGYSVRGVDQSPGMLVEARALVARLGLGDRCSFEEGALLGWLEQQVEQPGLLVCSSVLEYLEDPETALRLMCSRLAQGGTLLLSVQNPRSLLRKVEPLLEGLLQRGARYRRVLGKTLGPEEAAAIARQEGLHLAKQTHFGFPDPGRAVLGPLSSDVHVGTLTLLELVREPRRLHVLVNATSARIGGGLTVMKHLLPALSRRDGGRHRYTLLAAPGAKAALGIDAERVEVVASAVADSRGRRLLWEQLQLPGLLGDADVLLSPANLAVLRCPKPQVLIFQNVAPFDPSLRGRMRPPARLRLEALRQLGVLSARVADRVVFLSSFSRDLLLAQLGVPAARARVVHMGRDPAFEPGARVGTAALLERLGVGQPYVLSVSHAYFYKNLVELVGGFAEALPALPPGCLLLLAGALVEPGYAAQIRAEIERTGLGARVRLLGEVPYDDLPALMAGALVHVFSSTCENFPNTLVEGMAAGAPTLAGRLGPMPELAGDGAAYCDPYSPADIGSRLAALARDPAGLAALSARGIARAASYSWDRTADALLGVLEEV